MESRAVERVRTEPNATARLLRAYHERGETAARQRLIELYLPLVVSLARRHARGTDDQEDLYQVGCIGLINAIDRFDIERGQELAAFAVPNIEGEIRRHLRDRAATVRLPRRVLDLRSAASSAQTELTAKLGRAPTAAEIAAELGAAEDDVGLALDAARASQGVALDEDADGPAVDGDAVDERLFLADAFRGLDEREQRLVYLRFVRELSPADVARELGLSERQLSRATQTALARLRAQLEGEPNAGSASRTRPQIGQPDRKMGTMAVTPARKPETEGEGYHIELARDADANEEGWTARVEELSGCEAHGATPDEAVQAVEAAAERWIADATANHREVPKPRPAASHSGRLMLRMPQTLHADLARAAQREDVSLNQFINGVLAAAVEWRTGEPREQGAPAAGGWSRAALVTNVVVLAIVGIVALILLVVALT
jgi:RNA polymerase sigma-B factor